MYFDISSNLCTSVGRNTGFVTIGIWGAQCLFMFPSSTWSMKSSYAGNSVSRFFGVSAVLGVFVYL